MNKGTKWVYMLVGGFLAIGLVTGAGFVYLRSEAAAQRIPTAAITSATGLPSGWLGEGDRPMGKYEGALADALGITTEELQSAYDAVWKESIEAAVKDSKLSEDQAEQMLADGTFPLRRRGGPIGFGAEKNTLLAAELEITVSTLEAAQAKAHDTVIAEALKNGDLSEVQVEMMQARRAIAPYLQQAMTDAFKNAVDQALSDEAITPTQADLLLENGGPAMRGVGNFPGGPGTRGRGGSFPGERFFGADEN